MSGPRRARSAVRYSLFVVVVLTAAFIPTASRTAARVAPTQVSYNNALYGSANGFDTCAAKTSSMLSDWWNGTPWWEIGVYLGGSEGQHQGCYDGAYDVDLALSYGYGVTLYWYGPQIGDGCQLPNSIKPFMYFFSGSNTTTAYNQGVAEADSASASATAAHLPAGVRIFYDLEAYNGTSTCRAAAKSFINGWDHEMALNTSFWGAAYGSSCASFVSDWASIASVPIAISPSDVGGGQNDGGLDNGSAFGYPCLSDGAWTNDQRVGQFSIDNHTYGSTALTIDENCADSYLPSTQTGVNSTCSDVL